MSLIALQLEGDFDVGSQLTDHALIKLEQITRPGTVKRNAINPAHLCSSLGALPIIQHKVGKGFFNCMQVAKHQQARSGWADNPGLTVATPSTDKPQKLLVIT